MTRDLVAMAHVADIRRSAEFYAKLGFESRNTFTPDGADAPTWAWLESGNAKLMIALADEPIDPSRQAVMFYAYCDDVPTTHASLKEAGVAVGPITTEFYAPHGQFRIEDPDGYVVVMMHV